MRFVRTAALALVSVFMTAPVLAQTGAPASTAPGLQSAGTKVSQKERMKTCNAEAKTQSLKGDARKQFIATCLSGNAGPSAPATATAPAASRSTTVPNPTTAAPKSASAPTTAARTAPTPAAAGSAVFPSAVSPKYAAESAGKARMHTCLDQYNANKTTNGNGGLNWIAKGGGYYAQCNARLKAQAQ